MKSILNLSFLFTLGLIFTQNLQAADAAFTDVSETNTYADAVEYVETNGIVSGFEDGTFRPNNTISRGEFVKILTLSLFGEEAVSSCNPKEEVFTDLELSDWEYPYACTAKMYNIVDGYQDGTFRSTQPITFSEAAKVIVTSMYGDRKQTDFWYTEYVKSLSYQKAIPTSIKTLTQKITRGEMVEMIYRLSESITDKDSIIFDSASNGLLKMLSKNYGKTHDTVYFFGEGASPYALYTATKVEGADAKTFEVLKTGQGIDGDSAYLQSTEIAGSDAKSYEVLDEFYGYARDKNTAYYRGNIIPGSDPASFEVHVYHYATDVHTAYFMAQPMVGSDPSSFRVLDYTYTKDNNTAYFDMQPIAGADAPSFELLDKYYVKDKNNVYFKNEVIPMADPVSFEVLHDGFSKDATYVYYEKDILEVPAGINEDVAGYPADPDTFVVMTDYYGKDKDNIYLTNKVVEGVNIKTAKYLGQGYLVDNTNAFYHFDRIPGAEMMSFEVLDFGVARDRGYVYKFGKIIGLRE